MSRRKFREDKSKFAGTKQVLQNLNQTAHAIVHDADVSLPSGAGATGYVLTWSSGSVIRIGDISAPIFAPADGTIELVYASLPFAATSNFECDVLLNGVSIFAAANRPKVVAGSLVGADATPALNAVVARDAFEVEVLDNAGGTGRAIVYIVVT